MLEKSILSLKKAEIEKKSLNSAATSKFSLFSQKQKWMSGKKMDEIYIFATTLKSLLHSSFCCEH